MCVRVCVYVSIYIYVSESMCVCVCEGMIQIVPLGYAKVHVRVQNIVSLAPQRKMALTPA